MDSNIYNFIGTIGVFMLLTTYFMLQTERLKSTHLQYSVLNFLGSGMILVSLIHEFNFPSFAIELAWVLLSGLGIVRWFYQRNQMIAVKRNNPAFRNI